MKIPDFLVPFLIAVYLSCAFHGQSQSNQQIPTRNQLPFSNVSVQEYQAALKVLDSSSTLKNDTPSASRKPSLPIINQELDFENTSLNNWEVLSGSSTGAINLDFEDKFFQVQGVGVQLVSFPFDVNSPISLQSPLGGTNIAQVNSVVNPARCAKLRGKIQVSETSNLLKFACIAMLEQTGHDCDFQPFVSVQLRDSTGNLLYKYLVQARDSTFCHGHNQLGMGKSNAYYFYSNWQVRCVDLSEYIGRTIYVEFMASGCSYSLHHGYGYFDAKLESCPVNYKPAVLSIDNYTVDLHHNYFQYSSSACNDSILLSISNTSTPILWNGRIRNNQTSTSNSQTINSYGRDLYTLSFQNDTSCPITKSLYIQSGPEFTIRPFITTLCQNRMALFVIEGVKTASINGGVYSTYFQDSIVTAGIYSITASAYSKYGCLVTRTFTFNILPAPTLAIAGPNGFCGNGPIIVNATGAATYNWSHININATGTTTGSGSTFSITAPNYSVQLIGQSAAGCKNTVTYITTRSSSLSIFVSTPSYSVCAGSPQLYFGLSLFGNSPSIPPNTFSLSDGINTSTITAPISLTIMPTSTKLYSVSAANFCGVETRTFAVYVSTLTPTLSISPPSAIAPCLFTVGLSGANSYSTGPWASITGSVATYSFPFFSTPSIIATYSNSYCTDTKTLQYVSPSTVALQPTTAICVGSSVGFSITSNTVANFTIVPYFSPGNALTQFTAGASFNYTIPAFCNGITVQFVDANGCIASTNFPFNPTNPNLYYDVNGLISNSYTLCTGQVATLTLVGAQNYSINSIPSNSIVNLNPASTTVYTISAANSCLQSAQVITITPVNASLASVTITPNSTACLNKFLSLTASGATSYTWANPSLVSNTAIIFVSAPSTKLLSYTDANGCARSSVPYVIIPVSASISVPSNQTLCGTSAQSYTASGGQTYTWTINNFSYSGNPLNFVFPGTSIYQVSVSSTASNGCLGSANFQVLSYSAFNMPFRQPINKCPYLSDTLTTLLPSSIYSYTWSNGSSNPSILVPQNPAIVYSLTAKSLITGCIASRTVQSSAPINTVGFNIAISNNTVCEGGARVQYTFSAINGGTPTVNGIHLQGFHPSVPGSFPMFAHYFDNNNCLVPSTNTQVITVLPSPSVSLNLSDNQVCVGDFVSIVVNPSGGLFFGQNATLPGFIAGQTTRSSILYKYNNQNGCSGVDYTCFNAENCLGISTPSEKLGFRIAPNPFSDALIISCESNESFTVSVFDLNGRLILTRTANGSSNLETSEWIEGIYILEIQNSQGLSISKIVKQ